MSDIKITGAEIGAAGKGEHSLSCVVDGQRHQVIITQAAWESQKIIIEAALTRPLAGGASGVRRLVIERLRTALQGNHHARDRRGTTEEE